MRKINPIWHLLYYMIILIAYVLGFFGPSLLLRFSGANPSLGTAVAVTYGVLYVCLPALILVMMRLSLLRWYVDPFAAAAAPMFLYASMLYSRFSRIGDIGKAFEKINLSLMNRNGEGLLFLLMLFAIGLIASFSPARKNGTSISYRLLDHFFHK